MHNFYLQFYAHARIHTRTRGTKKTLEKCLRIKIVRKSSDTVCIARCVVLHKIVIKKNRILFCGLSLHNNRVTDRPKQVFIVASRWSEIKCRNNAHECIVVAALCAKAKAAAQLYATFASANFLSSSFCSFASSLYFVLRLRTYARDSECAMSRFR